MGRGIYLKLIAIGGVIVALDQITKQIALDALTRGPIDLIPGVLTLRLTFNSGGAFGVLQGFPTFFLVVTLIVLASIFLWVGRLEDESMLIPLGLVLGGGAGNVVDRVWRDFDGKVVDFVDLHVWPVFNLADSAITLGVLSILVLSIRLQRGAQGEPAA